MFLAGCRRLQPDMSGAEGGRTLYLCIANAALSQMSYGPETVSPMGSYARKRLIKRYSNWLAKKCLGATDCPNRR